MYETVMKLMAIGLSRLLVKARSTEQTEYVAVEKTKSFMIKYIVYYYQFLLLLIKDFSRFVRWGSKKMGLLKNTYDTKLPKAIVVFQVGL